MANTYRVEKGTHENWDGYVVWRWREAPNDDESYNVAYCLTRAEARHKAKILNRLTPIERELDEDVDFLQKVMA